MGGVVTWERDQTPHVSLWEARELAEAILDEALEYSYGEGEPLWYRGWLCRYCDHRLGRDKDPPNDFTRIENHDHDCPVVLAGDIMTD